MRARAGPKAGEDDNMKKTEIGLLIDVIDQAYNKRAWHGTNLRGSIRGLSTEQAVWRPGKGRHNIWEIALHAAYWKYTIRRRLLGEKRGSFPLKGSNFFVRTSANGSSDWNRDARLLDDVHAKMREAIASLPASRLHKNVQGSKWTYAQLVYGIASHDLYHAGQIQLLKRLFRHR